MKPLNILVFPCGSEIALEIHRSLKYSVHFNLIGASSVDDHGKYVFENYIDNIPFHDDKEFVPSLQKIVSDYEIDAIYPAMDLVALTLKKNELLLNCRVVCSSIMTTQICSSKAATYKIMQNVVNVPEIYIDTKNSDFPIFIKPVIGYGSRNTFKADDKFQADSFLEKHKSVGDFVLCELLEGHEYTVDCFTDRYGVLRFSETRRRHRVSNGISVNTLQDTKYEKLFKEYANKINAVLDLRGAWFFQMKESKSQGPKLLEIATRLGGSSSLFRAKGVNFALLSLFDIFDMDIDILENSYSVELDRALSNRYKVEISYKRIYLDYDDCLVIDKQVNSELISLVYSAINKDIKISLITKHAYNLEESLKKFRLNTLFDEIIHLTKEQKKSDFIRDKDSIFIDDSYQERKEVLLACKIPVFSPDMVEVLL